MGDYRPKIEERVLRQLLRIVLLLCLALFQTSLAPTFWRFRADWVLIAVVGWTLLRGLVPGLRWAVYGGVSLDLLAPLPLGSHLLALLLCVIVVAFVTEPLDREQPLLLIGVMLGASLLYAGTLTVILAFTGSSLPWYSYALTVLVPTALVNTIIAIPTFALLRRLERRGQPVLEA